MTLFKMEKESYYITGVSGTGKSTIAKELQMRGRTVFDLDFVKGLCHWRNRKTKERASYRAGVDSQWLNMHEWICDQGQLRQLLEREANPAAVGVFSNQIELLPLFSKIFLLYCSSDTIEYRLNTRTENIFGKSPSELKAILRIVTSFQKEMISLGAIPINTGRTLKEVVDHLESEMEEARRVKKIT